MKKWFIKTFLMRLDTTQQRRKGSKAFFPSPHAGRGRGGGALENHERKTFSGDELNELTLRLQKLYEEEGKNIEEIAIALEIHPASVVVLRRELDLVNPAELKGPLISAFQCTRIDLLKRYFIFRLIWLKLESSG